MSKHTEGAWEMAQDIAAQSAINKISLLFTDRSLPAAKQSRPAHPDNDRGASSVTFFLDHVLPDASPMVQRAFMDAIVKWKLDTKRLTE